VLRETVAICVAKLGTWQSDRNKARKTTALCIFFNTGGDHHLFTIIEREIIQNLNEVKDSAQSLLACF
jgi:hypothetical protein